MHYLHQDPILPAEPHEMTWPLMFVTDIMMLLKDALMWTCPTASTTTIRFLALSFLFV